MNQWLNNHKLIVFVAIGLLIAGAIVVFAIRWQSPAAIVIETPPPTNTPGLMKVYVSGAVAHPDVYLLSQGSIVKDAVAAAGGPTGEADLNHINLAQALSDNQQVYVPRIGEVPTQAASSSVAGQPAATGPININTATEAELESLPHIGPALAARIIQYREKNGPFARIEDIQKVTGIGPAIFGDIKDLITVK